MQFGVVDIGSFNIKTNKGIILENRFIESESEETFGAECIEYGDKKYIFGKGEFDKTFSKARKNFEISLLYGLGKSGFNGEMNLILLLPANQMPSKDIIIDRLKGKEFSFKINGEEFTISFNRVAVLKEGWSSFYSLPKRNDGLIAILDIGGRTTDIFTFNNGIQEQEKSLPIGTMNMFSDIADELVASGQNRKIEDVHKLFNNGLIHQEDFDHIFKSYAIKISNNIKVDIENLQDYKIFVTGGGSEFLDNHIKKLYINVEKIKDVLCSNCNGSDLVGKAKGFDK
ncbi:MAG: ParM/StbA family protein [Clostridium sp.]